MNGVCVRWKGRIDLDKLDGTGCLEFDEERAMVSTKCKVPAGNNNIIIISHIFFKLSTIILLYTIIVIIFSSESV